MHTIKITINDSNPVSVGETLHERYHESVVFLANNLANVLTLFSAITLPNVGSTPVQHQN